MEKGFNYARFYTLLKKMPGADKETLVSQYTDGRTTSLRETTRQEYDRMCRDMERTCREAAGNKAEGRAKRTREQR